MKIKIILFIAFLSVNISFSQNYKFGKVSKEELSETQNSLHPDADATVLYREYKSFYVYTQGDGFNLHTEVFERVKIYTKEGFNWATKKGVIYNHGKDREEITSIKGVTYNLEGGSIQKTKLKKGGVFEERISDYRVRSKFTMPNIKPGSVIEYSYKIISPFNDISDIELQYEIPIKKEIVEVSIPEYYVYKHYGNPQSKLNYSYSEDTKKIDIEIRGSSGVGTANYDKNYDRSGGAHGSASYKERTFLLDEENIPPLKSAIFVDNLDNYRATSIWELSVINFPGSTPKTYSTDWGSVTKNIYENDSFVNQLNKTNYFENDINSVIEGAESPLEKMNSIFNFVKSKVKWNNYYGYFPSKGVKKAYNEGSGNIGDINLMLVSMLRYAKLNANPVLVSTIDNGIPVFPTREGFNYVIAAVEFNGKLYLLDASEPFSSINLLPEVAMNWQGRLIRENGTSDWVGLYPGKASQKLTYVQAEIINSEVKALVRVRYSDHYAKNYRVNNFGEDLESQIKKLPINDKDVLVSELEVKDLDNLKPTLSLSYKVSSSSVIEEINEELYFSPMLFFTQLTNPFKADNREYPIYFGFPKSKKFTINIKLPEDYKVTSMPENAKGNLVGNMGGFTYLLKELPGNMLQLSVTINVNSPIILSDDFEYVKNMYNQIVEKENEKVVLSKI